MRRLTGVSYEALDSSTPARVNRNTGHLTINTRIWPRIPFYQRIFIILHEEGHYVLQTTNELEADRYAGERYQALGFPLRESVYALSKILPWTSPEHSARANAQFKRAVSWDINHNKNRRLWDRT